MEFDTVGEAVQYDLLRSTDGRYGTEPSWTVDQVMEFLDDAPKRTLEVIAAVVSMPNGTRILALSQRLGSHPLGVGKRMKKVTNDARNFDRELPPPMRMLGEPGAKTLLVDVSFLRAYLEIYPDTKIKPRVEEPTHSTDGMNREREWTAELAQLFLEDAPERTREVVEALVSAPNGTRIHALAKRLGSPHMGVGNRLQKVTNDTRNFDWGLQPPMRLVGEAGAKTLLVDASFLRSYLETHPYPKIQACADERDP